MSDSTPRDQEALIGNYGSWNGSTPMSYTIQWLRCSSTCASIAGATSQAYTAVSADVGLRLAVTVTATNSYGSSTRTSSQTSVVAPVSPTNTALPVVSGTAAEGQALSATSGSWIGTPTIAVGYKWKRCDVSGNGCGTITGAASSTYTPVSADAGSTLRGYVTATNAAGATSASSAPTAIVAALPPWNTVAPSISDTTPRDGDLLSGYTGSWAGAVPIGYALQWLRCDAGGAGCLPVPGQTVTAYTATSADVGFTLRIQITAANPGGSTVLASAATAVVAPIKPANLVLPVESGTAVQGQTLSTTLGTWTGTPTIVYGYRWKRCDGAGNGCGTITGATSQTYALQNADIGFTVRSYVTATNAAGPVSVLSAPSALVAPAPPVALAAPSVSDPTPVQDETFSGRQGTWSGTLPITYTSTWLRCDATGQGCSTISGQTGSSYTAAAADVGSTLRFEVLARNAGGSIVADSAATAVVLGAAQRPGTTAAYRGAVLGDGPIGFWPLDETSGSVVHDASAGGSHTGTAYGGQTHGQLGPFGGGSLSTGFNGATGYDQFPSTGSYSIPTTGVLTIEAWLRPDAVVFPDTEGSGYVYALGKGDTNQMEWGLRVYSADNTESPNRQNRICLYVWNPIGGEGAGAYVQDAVTPGQWIHIVAEATTTGVRMYKNGVLRMTDDPASPLYSVGATYADPTHPVTPVAGSAPLRIGTRNGMSYFPGGIAAVAVYTHLLSDAAVLAHYLAAVGG